MYIQAGELSTKRHPAGSAGRVAQFPLTRMILAMLFLAAFLIPHNNWIVDAIRQASGTTKDVLVHLDDLVSLIAVFLLYRLYVRRVEGRQAHELGRTGSFTEFGAGVGISLALVGLMVLLMVIPGYYSVESVGSLMIILKAMLRFAVGAFVQVLLFRLILFRLTEEWLGTWVAMAIIAAVFGAAHLANQNVTAWACFVLILSDILLIAAFILTRRVWFVWGIHFGWNFFQDGVFGMANSGEAQFPSWITPSVTGPAWLTGGDFGIEASVVSLVLNVVVGAVLLVLAIRRRQIVRPSWKRRPAAAGVSAPNRDTGV